MKTATELAQQIANQELDACVELLDIYSCPGKWIDLLRAARRSKAPSLKQQALNALQRYISGETVLIDASIDIIRRALEQMPDD